jgi:carbonic anhydrase/acetyltransferase-like protein (isoleucine patch superfamily)
MIIKNIIRKIMFGNKYNSDSYITYLKKLGMLMGENILVVKPRETEIDITRPWLIEIGNNVTITAGVTILTHGYDFSVIMNKYNGEMYGSSGKVKIGNNVFIGTKSTILKGVEIGDNVIIGANSLVNKSIPSDVVVAGNPAKVIMTLEEYRNKRKNEYINEAKELAIEYYKRYKKKPTIEQFHEFFMIMLKREDIGSVNFGFLKIPHVRKRFLETKPIYNGIEDFLRDCEKTNS